MTEYETLLAFEEITGNKAGNLGKTYLTLAREAVLNRMYPVYRPDTAVVPERYNAIVLQVAIFLYGKRGIEGAVRYSEDTGIDISYETGDIPAGLLRGVVPAVYVPGEEREVQS